MRSHSLVTWCQPRRTANFYQQQIASSLQDFNSLIVFSLPFETNKACCCNDRGGLVESAPTDLLCVACRECVSAENCANQGKRKMRLAEACSVLISSNDGQQKIQMIRRRCPQVFWKASGCSGHVFTYLKNHLNRNHLFPLK